MKVQNLQECFLGSLRQAFRGSKIFNLLYVTNGNILQANELLSLVEEYLDEELPTISIKGVYYSRSGKKYSINIQDRTIDFPEDSCLAGYFMSEEFQKNI